MMRKAASIYRGLLVTHSLFFFFRTPIWDMKEVQWDPNSLLYGANSETLPAHLFLVGWKVWSCQFKLICFVVGTFCLFSVCGWVCVFWYICKFCCKYGAEIEIGLVECIVVTACFVSDCSFLSVWTFCVLCFLVIYLLFLLPAASYNYHGCFYGQGSEFIWAFWLLGWVQ